MPSSIAGASGARAAVSKAAPPGGVVAVALPVGALLPLAMLEVDQRGDTARPDDRQHREWQQRADRQRNGHDAAWRCRLADRRAEPLHALRRLRIGEPVRAVIDRRRIGRTRGGAPEEFGQRGVGGIGRQRLEGMVPRAVEVRRHGRRAVPAALRRSAGRRSP